MTTIERVARRRPRKVAEHMRALSQQVTTRRAPLTLPQLAADVVGPTYIPRPHTNRLIAALQNAVERADRGEDTRLVISMPPGMGKSTISSVIFPLWLTLNRPTWEVGIISAEASLAEKFSGDIRRHYEERGTRPATGGVKSWTVDHEGGVVARGISGGLTGRRLRVAIIDDPLRHLEDAYSEAVRRRVWNIWTGVIKTRLRPGSIVLSIATRWHLDDLNGRLLREGGWDSLIFPAFAEQDDELGRAPGVPLLSVQRQETLPEAAATFTRTRTEVGSTVFNALYQQHPGEAKGNTFRLDWWRFYTPDTLPEPDQVITSWDLTFGSEDELTGDWNVGVCLQRSGRAYYIRDLVRFRGSFTKQLREIRAFVARHPDATKHVIEDAALAKAVVETLTKEIDGVIPRKVQGSKEVRATAVAPLAEARQVYWPSGAPWLDQALTELAAFPKAVHDDVVDAITQGLKELRQFEARDIIIDNPGRLPGW